MRIRHLLILVLLSAALFGLIRAAGDSLLALALLYGMPGIAAVFGIGWAVDVHEAIKRRARAGAGLRALGLDLLAGLFASAYGVLAGAAIFAAIGVVFVLYAMVFVLPRF